MPHLYSFDPYDRPGLAVLLLGPTVPVEEADMRMALTWEMEDMSVPAHPSHVCFFAASHVVTIALLECGDCGGVHNFEAYTYE